MHRRGLLMAAVVLTALCALAVVGGAKGPTNAGGAHDDPFWIDTAWLYFGDPEWCGSPVEWPPLADGTVIGPIWCSVVKVKLKVFTHVAHLDQEWDSIKYWLEEPAEIVFPSGRTATATHFIFLRIDYSQSGYSVRLQAYR